MKILITKPESVAIFFGCDGAEYRDDKVIFAGGGMNCDYNESNSMIIDADAPEPHMRPHVWKYENGSWIIANRELYDFYESIKVPEPSAPE